MIGSSVQERMTNTSADPRAPEILIVEDEAVVALEVQNRLRKLGYHVARSEATAEAALRSVEEHRPDLVLMDVVLAGAMTGIEAAKVLEASFDIPVVYLTAHIDAATLEQIKQTQEHGVVTKPFRPEQLQAAIEVALGRYSKERQRSAKERRTAEDNAQQQVQQFTYAAGHDLQEPLRTATAFMDLLARRADAKLDAEERKLLTTARNGLSRMSILLQDLLAFAQAGLSQSRLVARISAEAALNRAIASLQGAIAESGARITCDVAMDVVADASQLTQVFQNLLGNAIKYGRAGCRPEIHVGVKSRPGEFLFCVRDNGIGFDSRFQECIFEPFKRLHSPHQLPGTGLGLAICKHIIEAHGGRIWTESEPGQGSTFLFTLPDRGPIAT
jgi:signal transduction histidine kinase